MATVTTTVSLVGVAAAEVAERVGRSATNVSIVATPEPAADSLLGHRTLFET